MKKFILIFYFLIIHLSSFAVEDHNSFYIPRKNVRSLSVEEEESFIKGIFLLKNELVTGHQFDYSNSYNYYVKTHKDFMSNAHRGPAFLPWHREFILRFEKDI